MNEDAKNHVAQQTLYVHKSPCSCNEIGAFSDIEIKLQQPLKNGGVYSTYTYDGREKVKW